MMIRIGKVPLVILECYLPLTVLQIEWKQNSKPGRNSIWNRVT